jgi:hypothetical protein
MTNNSIAALQWLMQQHAEASRREFDRILSLPDDERRGAIRFMIARIEASAEVSQERRDLAIALDRLEDVLGDDARKLMATDPRFHARVTAVADLFERLLEAEKDRHWSEE